MVVPLEQARLRIDQLHLDRLQVCKAEIGALEDRLAAGEGGLQQWRDVAGAVVEARTVRVAAIMGIADLVCRLAFPADSARKSVEGLARRRFGRQDDLAAAHLDRAFCRRD